MCPDPQLLSIYLDGELPSPWKEKMQKHFENCSACREKLENFTRLFNNTADVTQEIIKNDITIIKERVWSRIEAKQNFPRYTIRRTNILQRRLSVPLPAAAAAAVVILLLSVLWFGNSNTAAGMAAGRAAEQQRSISTTINTNGESAHFILAAEMDNIDDYTDMSGMLQYLTPNTGTNIIILQLPESRNFHRSGEPAIIRAADYQNLNSRRHH